MYYAFLFDFELAFGTSVLVRCFHNCDHSIELHSHMVATVKHGSVLAVVSPTNNTGPSARSLTDSLTDTILRPNTSQEVALMKTFPPRLVDDVSCCVIVVDQSSFTFIFKILDQYPVFHVCIS